MTPNVVVEKTGSPTQPYAHVAPQSDSTTPQIKTEQWAALIGVLGALRSRRDIRGLGSALFFRMRY
jgi:hypothetical protein